MTQPTPAEQLLNLANRAERHGGLTPDEAQRLRTGLAHHCARAERAERVARSAARDAEKALKQWLAAEAAIERVRKLASRWENALAPDRPYARSLRAALDEHQEQ